MDVALAPLGVGNEQWIRARRYEREWVIGIRRLLLSVAAAMQILSVRHVQTLKRSIRRKCTVIVVIVCRWGKNSDSRRSRIKRRDNIWN